MNGCARTPAVLLLLVVAVPLAAAQPWPLCDSSSGNYSAGSTYETNLLNLIVTLRQNASSSPSLFASSTRGTAPDTVYGLMICRGDVSASDCADCGTSALQNAGTACGRLIRDVALCNNQCYVRLSDVNFLASTNNSGEVRLRSGANITSSDVAGYNRAVNTLLNATLQYAVDNSSRLFATGRLVGPDPGFSPIFSAAQCSPDLSPAQCRSCLQDLLDQWWAALPRNEGGARIAGTRCSLRSELGHVPFYTGTAMLQLPATAAAPGPAPTVEPRTPEGQYVDYHFLRDCIPKSQEHIVMQMQRLPLFFLKKNRGIYNLYKSPFENLQRKRIKLNSVNSFPNCTF
jgi:hypothetical protein